MYILIRPQAAQQCSNSIVKYTGSHQFFSLVGVQVLYQGPHKAHLASSVLKNHLRIIRLAAQTVRRPNHRDIVDVHLGDLNDLGSNERLNTRAEMYRKHTRLHILVY